MDTMDTRMGSGSPPPRFSETGSNNGNGTPRFTEHFNTSPPYQGFAEYDASSAPIPRYEQPDGPAMAHRLSNKDRPMSPSEVVSPMPEAYRKDEEEKEVAAPPLRQGDGTGAEAGETTASKRRRICGLPLLWLLLVVGLIIALAIGLGVGLGVGLNNGNSSSSNDLSPEDIDAMYSIGGAINPAYYSTTGAFNGSGIALAQQSFSADVTQGAQGVVVVYFQHWTGEIRFKRLSNSGVWQGGDEQTVVASDAKNNTPLSAVSYVGPDNASTWHVFYVDQNNTLKQRSNSNATTQYTTANLWVDGPINNLNLTVMDADIVGMQACWYGNHYGDSDYAYSPVQPGTPNATNTTTSEVGMHMWFPSDNTTFQQYGWRLEGNNTWEHQYTFENMNGHAGVGCFSWGLGTVTYAMFVNSQNIAEVWWRDTDTNVTATPDHPINEWVKSSIGIAGVWPTSSLGYTNSFYLQRADDLYFHGYNISWAAENTTLTNSFRVDSAEQPIPGSHLSVTELPGPSGGNNLYVFMQTNGTDISEYNRDVVAGPWSSVPFSIPTA